MHVNHGKVNGSGKRPDREACLDMDLSCVLYVMKTEKQLLYVFLLVNVVAIEVALFVRPKTTRCCSDVEAKGLITDVRTSTIAQ